MTDETQRELYLNVIAMQLTMMLDTHELLVVFVRAELYRSRGEIPRVEVDRGRELRLRHFQSGLKPVHDLC